jgi:hypothetical protein
MAIHWAKPKASLLKQWKRLVDPDGCDLPRRHAFGATFFEMVTDSGSNLDEEDLPRSVFDRKQGLWFSRNAYAGPQDAVLGAFARCYHPGGHSQADAGSFRFSALGWDWVIGGGQARPEARWQSVVTTSDPAEKPRCGGVLWEENCVFGMELRSVHQSYSERYLAFRAGGPVAVAVLDLIDDHRNDRDWFWNLTFSPEMSWTFREFGFELLAPDGALMRVAFLGTPFLEMDVVWSPESERTYANGKTLSYISRPAVQVKFPRVKSLNIYALITVHGPGESMPSVSLGKGLDVKWGAQAWERPFGMVFPRDLKPGTIRGQCRFPS